MRFPHNRASLLSSLTDANYHTLKASSTTVHWGYFDKSLSPALTVDSGDLVYVETVTHHAGDAPDLMMDEGTEEIYHSIPEEKRSPGPHLLTGPIYVKDAEPGDMLEVEILDLAPRIPYGSNVTAPWGFLYDEFDKKERVTIYEIDPKGQWLTAKFAYDYPGTYDINGRILLPDEVNRVPALSNVQIPARLHIGTMGVAPAEEGPVNTIPPYLHGGNIDNWRIGAGTTMYYPVFNEGALLSLGDAHLTQGDCELSGTAVEGSLNCLLRVTVRKDFSFSLPLLETSDSWIIHAFHEDLDEAARIGSLEAIRFLHDFHGMTEEDAYSFLSVAADFSVTQVVNENKGIHIALPKKAFGPSN